MKLAIVLLSLFSTSIFAGDIAFGTLKAIKVYDYPSSKVKKLYFSDDATFKLVEECDGIANITHSLHSEMALNQMMSIALAGYMSGKKVRANFSEDTCELDFFAIQESRL